MGPDDVCTPDGGGGAGGTSGSGGNRRQHHHRFGGNGRQRRNHGQRRHHRFRRNGRQRRSNGQRGHHRQRRPRRHHRFRRQRRDDGHRRDGWLPGDQQLSDLQPRGDERLRQRLRGLGGDLAERPARRDRRQRLSRQDLEFRRPHLDRDRNGPHGLQPLHRRVLARRNAAGVHRDTDRLERRHSHVLGHRLGGRNDVPGRRQQERSARRRVHARRAAPGQRQRDRFRGRRRLRS